MTFGAALIPNDDRAVLEERLESIAREIGKKDLHCSNLSHFKILYFAREIIKHRMRLFGVISYKDTLGNYKDRIEGDHNKYYNKCVQYLFERVGWFLETRRIDAYDVDIVFEKTNCDYDMMRNFLCILQSNPKHEMTRKLRHLNVEAIEPRKKSEDPLLKIADLVAHSLFKCADKNKENLGIPEPRYVAELAPRFFGDPETNKLLGAGLYCVHNTYHVKLDPDVREVVTKLVATS